MKTVWEKLMESTEGPQVTVSIPRHIAEDLLRALSTALEVEDEDDVDMDGDVDFDDVVAGPHMEPDEDDLGGEPDGDADDDELLMPAGDDDSDDDDESDDDEDDEDDDEDQEEESAAPPTSTFESLNRALNEKHIGFKKLKGQLAKQGASNPGGLAASIGRKKYGNKEFARMSRKGK